ncbi:MAG: response regulator [Syntrophorhabdales bacterium]|jgi:CheY-like chemotaxis protein
MKKTIVIADRDESLQHAFMTVFSKANFEIIHAANGKEVERIAERINPDVYIVNVNLPKVNGIEVYKKLQKQKFLETASFFFLKDESDATELLGYQADGVIEKPINFFRVYETITKEDDAIELTDLVEDNAAEAVVPEAVVPEARDAAPGIEGPADGGVPEQVPEPLLTKEPEAPPPEEAEAPAPEEMVLPVVGAHFEEGPPAAPEPPATPEPPAALGLVEQEQAAEIGPKVESAEAGEAHVEESLSSAFGARLKDAMESLGGGPLPYAAEGIAVRAQEGLERSELEARIQSALASAMAEAGKTLSAELSPVLSRYVEDYVKRMLLEIAERVIREEIDKLLKESA